MKLKIIIFLAGMLTSLVGVSVFQVITNPYSRSMEYHPVERGDRFMKFLDSKGIMYSYEINHLRRHIVTPHISNESDFDRVIAEFEKKDHQADTIE